VASPTCSYSTLFIFTARSLLKKYYPILLDNFPDDHVTTIGIMSEMVSSVDDRFFNEILSTVNPREANERMLNAIIIMLKHDDQIMEMCKLAKLVMRSARFSKEMLEFEIRALNLCVLLAVSSVQADYISELSHQCSVYFWCICTKAHAL